MRNRAFISVICVAVLFALGSLLAQPKSLSPTRQFMRQKLEHTQRVLEGISLEDFELVAKHARKLSAMSQEASWRAFDNPEYVRFSDSFRRDVNALNKAAADHNLDAATLAYVKMTMGCVECHKFVRGKKVAKLKVTTP
jgi:hypothetical protein